jgi:copper chaperone CopZ
MTCGNCVKIIETVLKGVNGQPSPIEGILDAAADRELSMVIIKIEKSSFAKRIAHQAKESLKMVGYDAVPKEMAIIDPKSGSTLDLAALRTAFDIVAATDSRDVFDWNLSCTCPDNGVVRNDCLRHSQMNKRIFEAFDERQEQVKEFMGGCGRRYGLACSCGANCQCKSGSCCGPLANGMGNRNAMMNHDGSASENGLSCGRQAANSFSPVTRGFFRSLKDMPSMGPMLHGNTGVSLMPRTYMHAPPANQFFDHNIQATPVQSQTSYEGMSMPLRVPTTPIRTGNSSSMIAERMDLGERMERNPVSAHQHQQHQHSMSDYMRNMNNTSSSGNFGGYTWKPESLDNQSKVVNHSIFWNSP